MSIRALERHLEPLYPFLDEEEVTEICINQPQQIFVEKNRGFTPYLIPELTLDFLESLVTLVAEYNHKIFPAPLISGRLPSGARIQCVSHPACERNTIICSIRRHLQRDIALEDYEKEGVFQAMKSYRMDNSGNPSDNLLKNLLQQGDILNFIKQAITFRKNILISGGTGTGKTTFLNACLKLIPVTERLITVEDTREVHLTQENKVHLLFNEEDETINALKIFKVCLRLRPDRIFLSELRGAEVWPFLRAANSGHPGSISTVHADTPKACFDQLVFMMQQAGSTSTEVQLKNYIQSIIPIVIQLKREPTAERFMTVSDIYFNAT